MKKQIVLACAAAGLALGAGVVVSAQTAPQTPAQPAPAKAAETAGAVPEIAPGILMGYLQRAELPDSLSIIPPPPAQGSATQARDDAAAKAARALKGSPRWTQATQDAALFFPAGAETYSCALGIKVSQETTPRLYVLLRRVMTDAGLSTYPTKNKFMRKRPFMVDGGDICTPKDEKALRADGSYPSGHSAIGWAWALTLAEAEPDRATQILARGRQFMQSRVVCNVHWRSDTEAGATMGSSTVARLHANATFRADLEAAKAEIAAARAAGQTPTRDCQAEAAALASAPIEQP